MPKVDFYILESEAADARLTLACRIAEKAMNLDQKVLINTASPTEAARLDTLLWTFSQGSFVPHRIIDAGRTAGFEPVLIGCDTEPPSGMTDLMINLADTVPEFFGRYARVAEVVDGNADRRAQGRERFKIYRERGCELDTHQM